ncbi:hypothetical protein AAG906_009894 [Vitis piasezkii]
MATPSQSQSSGRGGEDDFKWRQAIEKRQLASEKQLKALLHETERLREENAVLRIQASTSGPPRRQRSRGQVANSCRAESIYPSRRLFQGHITQGLMSHIHLCLELPVRKAQTQLIFQEKALGPQEPGRPRPPVAATWAPRPDPINAPRAQNVPPHRDPVVTPAMRNVHSLAPSAKGWMTCSPRPFTLISSITSPPGDSSYQNFPHTMEPTIPSITSCIIDSS